jgi:hypothetical protein
MVIVPRTKSLTNAPASLILIAVSLAMILSASAPPTFATRALTPLSSQPLKTTQHAEENDIIFINHLNIKKKLLMEQNIVDMLLIECKKEV